MKKSFKKISALALTAICILSLAACSKKSSQAEKNSSQIYPISREDGSGTRGAFIELFGIEQKTDNGEKIDLTDPEIEVTNSTSAVIESVAKNKNQIGYISLGSLNDSVKAVKIDNVKPDAENIKSGKYLIARPFNIVISDKSTPEAKNFIDFIMSKTGQDIIEKQGYIRASSSSENYQARNSGGKVSVSGSSSVTPVMQKLAEAYMDIEKDAKIEVSQSDSTTGINSLLDGACDIGMASRDLKDSEIKKGAKPVVIAKDGIAVIINQNNPVDNLSKSQVKDIYTKKIISWDGVK